MTCQNITHNFANRTTATGQQKKKKQSKRKKERQRELPSDALKEDAGHGEWFHRLKSAMKCREWFDRLKVALGLKHLFYPKGTSDQEPFDECWGSPQTPRKPSRSNADEMSSPDSVKWASDPKTFESQIEEIFNRQKEEKERPPLLKNWEAYLEHLPRREGEEDPTNPLILYKCPYYVGAEDLDRFANSLVSPPEGITAARGAVRSIVAPPGAGKSAAVLPAFLQMHNSKLLPAEVPSMYIYMPFYNNAKRRHRAPDVLSSFLDLIRLQRLQFHLGQAYMLCCFDLMLHGEYYRWWFQLLKWFIRAFFNWAFYSSRVDDLWQHSVQQLVKQAVGDGGILVHVDEHFAMSTNPDFRSGALGVLAQAESNCLVVTTYTAVTFEFQTRRSDISRYFVALPPLQSLEALSENEHWKLKGEAAEKFRTRNNSAIALSMLFSMLVQGMGPKWLHVSPEKLSVNETYGKQSLRDFYHKEWNEARCSKGDDGLERCCRRCSVVVMQYMEKASPPQEEQASLVFRLIRGIPINSSDEELQSSNMSLHSVVGFEEIITKPLVEMLKIEGGTVWEKGRTLLLKHIKEKSHLINVDKVLECAFICAFALTNSPYHERPTKWRCGKLFVKEGQGQEVVVQTEVFGELKNNELVYTDDKPCHPYVDLWMKTGDKELTVMQVTGSRVWPRVSQKCKDLEKALHLLNESQNHKKDRKKWKFKALMLAPNVAKTPEDSGTRDQISVLTTEARGLLGGLAQLCTYI